MEIPAPDVTLLQLIHALFWELSFFGTPKKRDATREELRQRVERIDRGEERLIPWEEVPQELGIDATARGSKRSREYCLIPEVPRRSHPSAARAHPVRQRNRSASGARNPGRGAPPAMPPCAPRPPRPSRGSTGASG